MTDELLTQFLVEAPELFQQASEDLIALERSPANRERLDGAFRAVHTLKGSAGLFDFAPMSRVLHAAEDVLGRVRDGRQAVDRALIDAVLAAVNQTERWIEAIGTTGAMPPAQHAAADRRVRALEALVAPDAAGAADIDPDIGGDASWVRSLILKADLAPAPGAGAWVAVRYTPAEGCYFAGDDPLALARSAPGIAAFFVELTTPPSLDRYDPFACNLRIELLSAAPMEAVRAAFRFVPDQVRFAVAPKSAEGDPPAGEVGPRSSAGQILRIPAGRIDRLANLVDDLVLSKNALGELSAHAAAGADAAKLVEGLNLRRADFDRIVGQLYEQVVGLRLVELGPALRRLPRLVRELSAALGKSVDLTIDDGGVNADKTLVEGLFDPLLHILRNAVDHGVEPERVRLEGGKPARASIRLTARRAANQLLVDVEDDGRGIDPAAIRRTAERRGLLSAERLAALDDQGLTDLVFLPGFSTAADVTDISGRGVGMDAVRAALEALGGAASISSWPGGGTTVRLALPLNATMTKLLVVSSHDELYGVPLDRVDETVRIDGDRIVPIRAGRAFVLREEVVPLVDLGELVGGPACDWRAASLRAIVVRRQGAAVAVRVDAVVDRMETVMRPLTGLMAGMPGMLGATLLGDGRIMMVLDLEALVG